MASSLTTTHWVVFVVDARGRRVWICSVNYRNRSRARITREGAHIAYCSIIAIPFLSSKFIVIRQPLARFLDTFTFEIKLITRGINTAKAADLGTAIPDSLFLAKAQYAIFSTIDPLTSLFGLSSMKEGGVVETRFCQNLYISIISSFVVILVERRLLWENW